MYSNGSMQSILDAMPKNSKIYGTLRKKVDKKDTNQPVYPVGQNVQLNDKNNQNNNSFLYNPPTVPVSSPPSSPPPNPIVQPSPLKQLPIVKHKLVDANWTQDEINEEFTVACEWGYLPKAKRIWNEAIQCGKPVDIHYDNDRSFRHSCYYGFLGIAKWLYNVASENNTPINVRNNSDYAFSWACENKHFHVAQWLETLCDAYHVEFKYWID